MDQKKARAGRIGAHVQHSRHDPRDTTSTARSVFLRGFEDKVDPEGVLPEAERKRRAKSALRAHMAKLSYLAAEAKAKKKRDGA